MLTVSANFYTKLVCLLPSEGEEWEEGGGGRGGVGGVGGGRGRREGVMDVSGSSCQGWRRNFRWIQDIVGYIKGLGEFLCFGLTRLHRSGTFLIL